MMKSWSIAVVAAVLVATVLAGDHGGKDETKEMCNEATLRTCTMQDYAASNIKGMVMTNDIEKLKAFCNDYKMAHECVTKACEKTEKESGTSKANTDGTKPDNNAVIAMKMRHHLPPIHFVATRICHNDGDITAEIKYLMSNFNPKCFGNEFIVDRNLDKKVNYIIIDYKESSDDGGKKKEMEICGHAQAMENKMRCRIFKLSTCNEATKTLLAMQYRMFKQSDMNTCSGDARKKCDEEITTEKLMIFRESSKRLTYLGTGDPHFNTKIGNFTCKTTGNDIVLFEKTGVLRILANITMVPNSNIGSYISGVHVALLDGGEGVAMQLNATQDRFDEKPKTKTMTISGTEYRFKKPDSDILEIHNQNISLSVALVRSENRVKNADAKFITVILKASDRFLDDFWGVFYDGCPDEERVELETASTTRRRRDVDTCGCSITNIQCAFDCEQTGGDPNLGDMYRKVQKVVRGMKDKDFVNSAGAIHLSIFAATSCMVVLLFLLA